MAKWYENYVRNYVNNHRNDSSLDRYNTLNFAMNNVSAKQQMDFQKMMSNTSHQRETQDLIRAGLNPALSLNNGASSPVGTYASVSDQAQSGKIQMKLNEQTLKNNKEIAQYQTNAQTAIQKYIADQQYALGLFQSNNSASASRFASVMSAMAQRYGSDKAYAATQLASLLGYAGTTYSSDIQKEIAQMNIDNPNTMYGMLRELIKGIFPSNDGRQFGNSGHDGMFSGVFDILDEVFGKKKSGGHARSW